MTSPRTPLDARPDQAADTPPRSTLTVTQVVAGALAAVSAAVVLSFLGVAGTVIGAALASVVSTVGSALYSASLARTTERLRRTREAPAAAPAGVSGAATRELPVHLDPRRAPAARRRPRWTRVAVYAVAVFATAMVVVTGIELVGQRPVSALVGGDDAPSATTTIGELSTASSGSDVPPADPGPAAPTTGAPDGTGEPETTDAPESTEGPPTPSGDAEEPAPETAPQTGGTDPGSGSGSGSGSEDTDTGTGSGSGETVPAEPSTPAPQDGGAGARTGPGA